MENLFLKGWQCKNSSRNIPTQILYFIVNKLDWNSFPQVPDKGTRGGMLVGWASRFFRKYFSSNQSLPGGEVGSSGARDRGACASCTHGDAAGKEDDEEKWLYTEADTWQGRLCLQSTRSHSTPKISDFGRKLTRGNELFRYREGRGFNSGDFSPSTEADTW